MANASTGQQLSRGSRRIMLIVALALAVCLLALQSRLWIGAGSLAERSQLQGKLEQQRQVNTELMQRNDVLAAEVQALKYGLEEVESRAREELGMIKPDETFYLIPASE